MNIINFIRLEIINIKDEDGRTPLHWGLNKQKLKYYK
jgi:hypothetical protein